MDWWQDIVPVDPTARPGSATMLGYQGQSRRLPATSSRAGSPERVLLVRSRQSRIYYRRRFFDYPLKLNANTLGNLGWLEACVLGSSYAKRRLVPRSPEQSLEDFFINRFGDRLYKTFFKDYTEKVWGVPCHEISAEWGAQRVKGLSVTTALVHAVGSLFRRGNEIRQKEVETSLIESFLYPRLGPGQMWEEVASRVAAGGGEVHLRHRVVDLRRRGNRVEAVEVLDLDAGTSRWVPCDQFISTMPISSLVRHLQPDDATVSAVAADLPYRDFMTAGLVVRKMTTSRDRTSPGHGKMPSDNWIYIQEPDVKLGRLQIFNNWSPDLVADPATVSLGLEYFCAEGDDLWTMQDDRFLSFAASELAKIGLIEPGDVLDGSVVRVPKAYPAYFGSYRRMPEVRAFLDRFENVYAIGRNGMHRYNNQDHSMLAAKAAVDCIAGQYHERDAIWSVNTEDDYHEEQECPVAASGTTTTAGRRAA